MMVRRAAGMTRSDALAVVVCAALMVFGVGAIRTTGRYLAKRALCVENMRQQCEAQILFAQDHGGAFSPNPGPGPGYVRAYGQSKEDCIYGNFKDSDYLPNAEILLCPVLASQWRPSLWYGSLTQINSIGQYACWNYQMDPDYDANLDYDYETGTGLYGYVSTTYPWFANWESAYGQSTVFDFVSYGGYEVHEPAWPTNLAESTSETAIVSHPIYIGYEGTILLDISHGGAGAVVGGTFETLSTVLDNPVGYGDGHVEVHSKEEIRARARAGATEYYY